MAELGELIARVEAATGPDRLIDADLCCVFHLIGHRPARPDDFDGKYGYSPGNIKCEHGFLQAEYYTGSIDTALALVERKLPGIAFDFGSDAGREGEQWMARLTGPKFCIEEHADTLPLAIILALLRAIAAAEATHA